MHHENIVLQVICETCQSLITTIFSMIIKTFRENITGNKSLSCIKEDQDSDFIFNEATSSAAKARLFHIRFIS